jgi:hypothetical protein
MSLSPFNIIELSTAVVTIAGGVALILKQIQQSRCKTCNVCYLIRCEREVPIDAPVDIQIDKSEDESKENKNMELPDALNR